MSDNEQMLSTNFCDRSSYAVVSLAVRRNFIVRFDDVLQIKSNRTIRLMKRRSTHRMLGVS